MSVLLSHAITFLFNSHNTLIILVNIDSTHFCTGTNFIIVHVYVATIQYISTWPLHSNNIDAIFSKIGGIDVAELKIWLFWCRTLMCLHRYFDTCKVNSLICYLNLHQLPGYYTP